MATKYSGQCTGLVSPLCIFFVFGGVRATGGLLLMRQILTARKCFIKMCCFVKCFLVACAFSNANGLLVCFHVRGFGFDVGGATHFCCLQDDALLYFRCVFPQMLEGTP